jgi:hypothetical protein
MVALPVKSSQRDAVLVAIPTESGVVLSKLTLYDEKENHDPLTLVATLPMTLANDEGHQQGSLQMWLYHPPTTSTTTTNRKVQLMLLLQHQLLYEYPDIITAMETTTISSSKTAIVSLQPSCRFEPDLATKNEEQQYNLLPYLANATKAATTTATLTLWHQVLAVLYRRGQGILVKPIHLLQQNDDDDDVEEEKTTIYRDKIRVSWQDDGDEEATKVTPNESSSKKRKASNVATTLGPGQAGHELVNVSDRPVKKQASKKQSSSGEEKDTEAMGHVDEAKAADGPTTGSSSSLTIAERLQQLAALEDDDDDDDEDDDIIGNKNTSGKANDDKSQKQAKFVPKQATTQSLTHLLQQACASNDDGLLELALSVRDVRIIEQSLFELAQQQQQEQQQQMEGDHHGTTIKWMDVLLTRLITRLANKPQRAEVLSLWIQCWLQQQQRYEASLPSASGSSWQNVQGLLQPLRNLLQERIQTFSLWLQLDGRLSMMKS